jgi:hypothetical protein
MKPHSYNRVPTCLPTNSRKNCLHDIACILPADTPPNFLIHLRATLPLLGIKLVLILHRCRVVVGAAVVTARDDSSRVGIDFDLIGIIDLLASFEGRSGLEVRSRGNDDALNVSVRGRVAAFGHYFLGEKLLLLLVRLLGLLLHFFFELLLGLLAPRAGLEGGGLVVVG